MNPAAPLHRERTQPRPGRGQTLVEFALLVPLLLGLLLAVFDAARLVVVSVGLANGVSAGARVASIPSSTTTQVQDAVAQAIILADTAAIRSSVTISPSPRVSGSPVTVSASSAFTFNPLIAALLDTAGLPPVIIQHRATATVEGAPL